MPDWTWKKMSTQNQSERLVETQLETLLFVLYYYCSFFIQLSFLMCFHQKSSQRSFKEQIS